MVCVEAGRFFEFGNVFVDDLVSEEVEVEVVGIVAYVMALTSKHRKVVRFLLRQPRNLGR
jgi:hypothetical protein